MALFMPLPFPHSFKPSVSSGFTLVELIITLIIIAVLAVTALPRMLSRSDVEEVALRDELINRLRMVQMAAMNARSTECHQLFIQPGQFGTSVDGNSCPNAPTGLQNITTVPNATLKVGLLTSAHISFDRLGRPTQNCAGGCQITISHDETQTIQIESEGFIHGL